MDHTTNLGDGASVQPEEEVESDWEDQGEDEGEQEGEVAHGVCFDLKCKVPSGKYSIHKICQTVFEFKL